MGIRRTDATLFLFTCFVSLSGCLPDTENPAVAGVMSSTAGRADQNSPQNQSPGGNDDERSIPSAGQSAGVPGQPSLSRGGERAQGGSRTSMEIAGRTTNSGGQASSGATFAGGAIPRPTDNGGQPVGGQTHIDPDSTLGGSPVGGGDGPAGGDSGGQSDCAASNEVCNGVDDDCDGEVDEEIEAVGMACASSNFGRCGPGIMACESGRLICNSTETPEVETCNGEDDDCDGQTDESIPAQPCDTGVNGRCQDGVRECLAGELSECSQIRQATNESCNGIDDDCDGQADETFVEQGLGTMCEHGQGRCAAAGVYICNEGGGGIVCNGLLGQPVPERCNGQDDDCNGIDDDVTGLGDDCTVGTGICMGRGIRQCAGNELVCVAQQGQPQDEICNGEDDDCDGTPDEGFNEGQSCRLSNNICDLGIVRCRLNGTTFCAQSALVLPGQPEAERCNDIDDDCDGRVDEENPEGGGACNTGLAGACIAGEQVCRGGDFVCLPRNRNEAELCNGQDDDCDGTPDEGFDVMTNALHCGACGQACPEPLNTTAICTAGQCSAPCNQDTYDNDDEAGCEYVCVRSAAGRNRLDPCDGIDDDCDGRADESHESVTCETDELGICREGVSVCQNGGVVCKYVFEPVCEVIDGQMRDEDCDGEVDEAPDNNAECAPPETVLERVCIDDNQFYYGMDMLVDEDGIGFSRANLLLGGLYYTRLNRDGTSTNERIQSGVLRLGSTNTFNDSDLIEFNEQIAVCYRKGNKFYVSLRQNDGSWDHEILIDGELAGADCALGTINNQLVTAYTRGTALWFATRTGVDTWVHTQVDGENGDVVGQGLDLVIHNDRAYIAHRNDTSGRLFLTYQSDSNTWQKMSGPAPVDVSGDGVPDAEFGSGFRPTLRVTNEKILVAHGTRPQTPDETGDGYLLLSETTMPPGDRFATESLNAQDGYGGGQAFVDYEDGYIVFSRYRSVTALFGNVYRLETAKSTDRRITRILPLDNFDGFLDYKYLRLTAASDEHGLPVYGFVIQQGASAQVCVYRPLDSDRDGTPDVIEAGQ